ncbi:hypothetical protein EMCRGX_G031271 [Ephydatia muelleri]
MLSRFDEAKRLLVPDENVKRSTLSVLNTMLDRVLTALLETAAYLLTNPDTINGYEKALRKTLIYRYMEFYCRVSVYIPSLLLRIPLHVAMFSLIMDNLLTKRALLMIQNSHVQHGFIDCGTLRASTLTNHVKPMTASWCGTPGRTQGKPALPWSQVGQRGGPTTHHDHVMVVARLVAPKASQRYLGPRFGLMGTPCHQVAA